VFARLLGAAHGTIAVDIAHGLALHHSATARQALIDATAAKAPDVARAAVTALGSRKDEAARPALEKLLDAGDAILRYRVVGALLALGAAPSHTALAHRRSVEKDPDVVKLLDQALRTK
jgi:HEAT repeat protein